MQDFLTWLIVATFLFSVLNFGLLFVGSLPTYEKRINQHSSTVITSSMPSPAPSPTAIALPLLPVASVEQADQNLDSQIDALILKNQFPTLCRNLLSTQTTTPPLKAKAKAKKTQHTKAITPKATSPHKKPSVADLRTLCSENQIKWRNVHAKNLHLTKSQMINALRDKGIET